MNYKWITCRNFYKLIGFPRGPRQEWNIVCSVEIFELVRMSRWLPLALNPNKLWILVAKVAVWVNNQTGITKLAKALEPNQTLRAAPTPMISSTIESMMMSARGYDCVRANKCTCTSLQCTTVQSILLLQAGAAVSAVSLQSRATLSASIVE